MGTQQDLPTLVSFLIPPEAHCKTKVKRGTQLVLQSAQRSYGSDYKRGFRLSRRWEIQNDRGGESTGDDETGALFFHPLRSRDGREGIWDGSSGSSNEERPREDGSHDMVTGTSRGFQSHTTGLPCKTTSALFDYALGSL